MENQKCCPPPGYSLPPPTNAQPLLVIPEFESALQSHPWYNETTFVIGASIGTVPTFQYAHRGDNEMDKDLFSARIRIASMTKIFTALAVLRSRQLIGWEDSITKFLPQLDEAAYAEVTIGALAGHTSGLGRFGYVGDLARVPGFSPSQLGLPDVERRLPGGDVFPGGEVCSKDQVIDMFNDQPYLPLSPNSAPLYSNISYNLLGMALEHVHSKPFEQIIQELIFDPIGMHHSSFETPDNRSGALLPGPGDRWFAAPFDNFNPSGGIWSTPNDILLFLEAIQSHKLLSPAQTRKWLQPSSLLPSLHQLVGAPWEIFRPTNVTVAVPRPIDMYTKAGGVAGYASHAVLVPEYNIALTIHAAGNNAIAAVQSMLPLVSKALIAHADGQAREDARAKYTGTYQAVDGDKKIELAVDHGPGLRIKSAIMNGVAIIPALAKTQGLNPSSAIARLYPTDSDSIGKDTELWSILLDRTNSGGPQDFAELECASWNWGDPARYEGERLDKIVFHMLEGKAVAIELTGWRAVLTKLD